MLHRLRGAWFAYLGVALASLLVMFGGALAQQPTFQIGVLAGSDTSLARGARLIARQVNQSGGVVGADGTLFRLELIFVPPTAETPVTEAARQLAAADVIAIIGPQTSGEAADLIPILSEIAVPVLTPADDASLIVDDTTDLLLRSRASGFVVQQALADYLINTLGITSVDVLQFDIESTLQALTFTSAYQSLGGTTNSAGLVNSAAQINTAAPDIAARNPQAVISYGNPTLAGEFYLQLRSQGYAGAFAHPQAATQTFRGSFQPEVFASILGSTTWSTAATDATSTSFISSYVRTFGLVPDALSAAGADSMLMISEALPLPGPLLGNLLNLDGLIGVQGGLSPSRLTTGETSNNVFVVELNEFGAAAQRARYAGAERISDEADLASVFSTPVPTSTPIPEGVVVARIISDVQNVRSGPSTNFNVIGQLQQDEEVRVVGANIDSSWLVIEFRGQDGWIANLSSLNEIIGSLNDLPIITPPASPTPAVSPTPLPPPEPDILIQAATVNPNPIRSGESFTITVTVANVGQSAAGTFSVAATLPPEDDFLTATVNSLAPGASTTVTLTSDFNTDVVGGYSTVIIADVNNQVAEGPGEANNNSFNYSYRVEGFTGDRTITLDDDETLRLSGDTEIRWDDPDIEGVSGTRVGLLTGLDFDSLDEDDVNESTANDDEVTPSTGDIVVILGDDDTRAIAFVEGIDDDEIELEVRVFD